MIKLADGIEINSEDRRFADPVASKAFEHLMAAYAEELQGQAVRN